MKNYAGSGEARPQRVRKKTLDILTRMGALALIFMLALMAGGCLVSDDDYKNAKTARDEYSGQLQRLVLSNDSLKREISQTYESCNLIGSQLSVVAAMNIHDKYTADLRKPPAPAPAPTPTPVAANPGPRAEPNSAPRPDRERERPVRTPPAETRPQVTVESNRPATPTVQPSPPPIYKPADTGAIDFGF